MENAATKKALDSTNELLRTTIDETIKNNATTSEHNKWIKWLTVLIVVLTAVTVFSTFLSSCNQTGRYASFQNHSGGLFIVDTRTSRIWFRGVNKMAYMGTIKNPKKVQDGVPIESNDDQKQ